jgi:hypothetical protein
MLGGNAHAGIGQLDDGFVAVGRRHHRHPTALRHRITRVQQQIQKHLLKLVLDASHDDGRVGQIFANLDPAHLELVFEQRENVRDGYVEIDRAHVAARRPGEVEQAVDDLRGTERLPLDLLEQLRPRVLRIGLIEQHLGEARDARERRVHFVRHTGREQTDGGHLLRQAQLLLQIGALGDVFENDDPAGLHVLVRVERRNRDVDEQRAPGVALPAVDGHAEERRAGG